MTGPPNDSFIQLTLLWGGVGLPNGAAVTIGCSAPTPPIEGFLAQVDDWIRTLVLATCSQHVTCQSVEVKVGPEATGPTFPVTVNQAGGLNAPVVAANTSVLVRKPVAGMSGRFSGRFYWPGYPEQDTTDGSTLSGAGLTRTQNAMNVFFGQLVGAEAQPVVFSSVSSDPRAVSSFVVLPLLATQRRRMRR